MVRQRKTRDLCQVCWQEENADYFPPGVRYGDCAECGDWGLVSRSWIAPTTVSLPHVITPPEATCQRPMLGGADEWRAAHEAAYGDEHDEACPLCGIN